MPYAANGQISQAPIEGGIEITQQQYEQALTAMLEGMLVSIDDGFELLPQPDPEPDSVEEPETSEPEPKTVFSAREFLRRFTIEEYSAARTHGNIQVQWALDNLISAQYVDIEDPDTIEGIDLLVAEGIISPQRKTELLAPALPAGG